MEREKHIKKSFVDFATLECTGLDVLFWRLKRKEKKTMTGLTFVSGLDDARWGGLPRTCSCSDSEHLRNWEVSPFSLKAWGVSCYYYCYFFFSFIKTPCVRLYCDERVSLSELTSGTFLLLFFFSSPLPLPITLVVLCGYTHVSVCLCMWRRWTPPDHSCVAFLSGGKEKTKVRGKHEYAGTVADVLL